MDPAGRTTRTYYDTLNRAVQTVQNLTNWAVGTAQPPTWNSANPDQNVPTQGTNTYYDATGNLAHPT